MANKHFSVLAAVGKVRNHKYNNDCFDIIYCFEVTTIETYTKTYYWLLSVTHFIVLNINISVKILGE